MKRFKKMKFNDLWALIGRPEEFNGYQVNQSCATIMERIAQTTGRLAVMGDDERRTLWLPFQTRRKYGGFDFVEPEKGLLWYKISIQQYKGIYYLIINDLQRQCFIFKSDDDHCGGRVIHEYEADLVEKALLQLEEYIQTVVDVRISNSSQLAGFAKGSDLIYFLKQIGNINYRHITDFAPTKELLSDYRAGKVDWLEYEHVFADLMTKRRINQRYKVADFDNCCFLCSEETPEHCHRRLLVELLQQQDPENVRIVHLV